VIRKATLRLALTWAQRLLSICGVLLLSYCAYAMADAWIFQRQENADLARLLGDRRSASDRPSTAATNAAVAANGLIGRLAIPRLSFSAMVIEGTDGKTLRRAVGHIPGTALPGQPGNIGLAGHRDTFLRPLKDLKVKDEIEFSTLKGDFRYEVESLTVVEPDDVGVLAQSDQNVLTLVTCYPFYYVGPAPKRWIVRARQVVP
jgi:sortase A